MRPKYETEKDRELERETIEALCRGVQRQSVLRYVAFPEYAIGDYFLFSAGRARAICEIKTRRCSINTYATYMIDVKKVRKMISVCGRLKVAPIMAVRWSDAIGWIDLSKAEPETIQEGGRYDRGDRFDIGQMMYIPIDQFEVIDGQ